MEKGSDVRIALVYLVPQTAEVSAVDVAADQCSLSATGWTGGPGNGSPAGAVQPPEQPGPLEDLRQGGRCDFRQ